jgi:hypothetical protein
MDIQSIQACWRGQSHAEPPVLEQETVTKVLANRTADLRRHVRRRLRREAGNYLPIMAVPVAGLVSGFTLNRLLAAGLVVVMLAGVMATLWWAEHSIEDTRLDRSLREALVDLGAKLDAAGRVYVAAYVAVFIASATILLGLVWSRSGPGLGFAGAVAAAALAVGWSYWSGRGHVERMFRRDRVALSECLRQLERPLT